MSSPATDSALFDLTGQVAIVTGTSRGLGQYLARALAKSGADLVLTSRDRNSLLDFQSEIEALGRRTIALELDVRNQQSIEDMVSKAYEVFGQINILVNNAGCNVRKPALEVTWDDWNLILDTNLRGSFFVAQAVARRMIPRGYGRIINIGSVTSVAGYAGLGPYGASRGGIRQLTMSLGAYRGKHSITGNCLGTGGVRPAAHDPAPQRQAHGKFFDAATTKPVTIGAAIPESWLLKFMIPPTVPTLSRGAISDGIDQPTGAAIESPVSANAIHVTAPCAECA